jgi:hypothetical protein
VIPQNYPLYGLLRGRVYLIVGWIRLQGVSQAFPVLAPLGQSGGVQAYRGPDIQFSITVPAPDPDVTATIPAVRPTHAWPPA